MSAAYQEAVAELDAVDESAPAISHLRSPESGPLTRWGLRRLRHRLALRQEVMELQARFVEGVPLTTSGTEHHARRPGPRVEQDGRTTASLADLGF